MPDIPPISSFAVNFRSEHLYSHADLVPIKHDQPTNHVCILLLLFLSLVFGFSLLGHHINFIYGGRKLLKCADFVRFSANLGNYGLELFRKFPT